MEGKKKRRWLVAAALWLAGAAPVPGHAGPTPAESDQPAVVTIEVADLARLRSEGAAVIDVRRADEWRSTGVIPGSTLITAYDADGQLLPSFTAEVEAAAGKDQPLVLICRSGNRSARAARLLGARAGGRPVYNVAGGVGAWSAAGLPLVPCPTC